MQFEFATATEIIFGVGVAPAAGPRIARLGARALLVTGASAGRVATIATSLEAAGIHIATYSVRHEPTLDDARQATALARAHQAELVVACGGGSAIDLGKAVAALLANPGDPLEYVEVIGRGRPIDNRSVPFVAIPTTAGTGAEVTKNAVLGAPNEGIKVSIRSPHILSRLAVVDPALTVNLPPRLTTATGLDALTQLLEPFVSARANPLVDALCLEALPRLVRALPRAVADGTDLEARTDMAFASLCSGLALANAGLGAVHGFAAAIGGRFDIAHGAVCAALLPSATRINIRALRERAADNPALERFRTLASVVTGRPDAAPDTLADWLHQLTSGLHVPGLAAYGITAKDADAIVAGAARANSMRSNPLPLERGELEEILAASL
jgi:alcohol dehydrogenase class IV